MLGKSMGAPIAYEARRHELDLLKHEYASAPWKSFLQATDPKEGLMIKYLSMGQLAAKFGNILFVHGALHEHAVG